MSRWVWFSICAILGLVMLLCGLLVPAHLRAVDASVIEKAGRNGPSLLDEGMALVKEKKLGSAQLVLQAAQIVRIPGQDKLGMASDDLALRNPVLIVHGGVEPDLEKFFGADSRASSPRSQPFTEFIVQSGNRQKALELLRASPHPVVQELLRYRTLTNTVIFSPSQSASGQALDSAVSICGLLAKEGHLTTGLRNAVLVRASEANRGGNSQPLEQVLMDLMSLGQRCNWGQLAAFAGNIDDAETLRLLTNLLRKSGGLPVVFCAVQLSGNPAGVAKYLMNYSQTGVADLAESLRFGAGGVKELLRRGQRLNHSDVGNRAQAFAPLGAAFDLASDYSLRRPWFALTVKWVLYLLAGFLVAASVHAARPAVSALERPLQVRGIHVAREFLFALGFLLVVLLLSEPFLAQESQKADFPFRLRLPTVGNVVPAGTSDIHSTIMNQLSLLTLLLFFVLQALIYLACLVKLAEIRRQNLLPRIKLKLLENEDHLFDAGLYLGFVGTIISLILVSLGVIKPSLMAAYSSTSFGIIFVSVFKIFHLRPLRRKLLLEAEAIYHESAEPAPVGTPFPLSGTAPS